VKALVIDDNQSVRTFVERVLREAGDKPEARITFMFRLATAANPDPPDLLG